MGREREPVKGQGRAVVGANEEQSIMMHVHENVTMKSSCCFLTTVFKKQTEEKTKGILVTRLLPRIL